MASLRPLRGLSHVFKSLPSRGIASSARLAARPRALALPRMHAAARQFAVSAVAKDEGAGDITLSQKIAEEVKYEQEAEAADEEPATLKTLREKGVWTIVDTPGNDEVIFTRKFGNEHIRLIFSISDIDPGLPDEYENENEEGAEGEEAQDPETGYPIRCSITITKGAGKGALCVDATVQDSAFVCDNISFYPDEKIAIELTAESDWKRRGMYIGPQFDQLDVQLQEKFEDFLSERGIDENLAACIPDYAEVKEQKEYVKWLKKVQKFVDA